MYVDMRDEGTDGMEDWDEEKLKEVVQMKHGEADQGKIKTDIVRSCYPFIQPALLFWIFSHSPLIQQVAYVPCRFYSLYV